MVSTSLPNYQFLRQLPACQAGFFIIFSFYKALYSFPSRRKYINLLLQYLFTKLLVSEPVTSLSRRFLHTICFYKALYSFPGRRKYINLLFQYPFTKLPVSEPVASCQVGFSLLCSLRNYTIYSAGFPIKYLQRNNSWPEHEELHRIFYQFLI